MLTTNTMCALYTYKCWVYLAPEERRSCSCSCFSSRPCASWVCEGGGGARLDEWHPACYPHCSHDSHFHCSDSFRHRPMSSLNFKIHKQILKYTCIVMLTTILLQHVVIVLYKYIIVYIWKCCNSIFGRTFLLPNWNLKCQIHVLSNIISLGQLKAKIMTDSVFY